MAFPMSAAFPYQPSFIPRANLQPLIG